MPPGSARHEGGLDLVARCGVDGRGCSDPAEQNQIHSAGEGKRVQARAVASSGIAFLLISPFVFSVRFPTNSSRFRNLMVVWGASASRTANYFALPRMPPLNIASLRGTPGIRRAAYSPSSFNIVNAVGDFDEEIFP